MALKATHAQRNMPSYSNGIIGGLPRVRFDLMSAKLVHVKEARKVGVEGAQEERDVLQRKVREGALGDVRRNNLRLWRGVRTRKITIQVPYGVATKRDAHGEDERDNMVRASSGARRGEPSEIRDIKSNDRDETSKRLGR